MEYVEGHTLDDELAAGKVFSEGEALRIIIQIGRALEHAHRQGFDPPRREAQEHHDDAGWPGQAGRHGPGPGRQRHRGRPGRGRQGASARRTTSAPSRSAGRWTSTSARTSTPSGATLYHLVTGRVPFEAPTPAAVMHKHLKEPLVPPDHINTNLSAGPGRGGRGDDGQGPQPPLRLHQRPAAGPGGHCRRRAAAPGPQADRRQHVDGPGGRGARRPPPKRTPPRSPWPGPPPRTSTCC